MPSKKTDERKERHSADPKSSVRAPAKKDGGGGKFTMGRAGDTGGAIVDKNDPNFDPDERRVDPDDGVAYKYDEMAAYYKGKFSKAAIAEYWYECSIVKKKTSKKAASGPSAGPTVADSARLAAKAKAKVKAKAKAAPRLSDQDMSSDGPLAKEIAAVIPHFPYKKLDKFYDIQGLLKNWKLFNAMCAVISKRYRKMGVTKVAAFDARGFVFSPVSIKMGVPFIMLRKDGAMPNTIKSSEYSKEYAGTSTICVQKDAITKDDKVVLLDDLMATGGTFCAGIELMKGIGAEVVECCSMIEIKAHKGREKCIAAGAKAVWSFISEDLLTTKADLPDGYVDDGKPH